MAIKGLSFDLFGTLLIYGDVEAAWSDWLAALHVRLRQFGLDIGKDDLAANCDGFFSRPEPPGEGDGMTVYERRVGALCTELGLDATIDQVQLVVSGSAEAWQRHIRVDPDAEPILAAVKRRASLAIVSNFDHPPHVRKVLREAGLLPYFDAVVLSGDVGVKKPDPRIFAFALRQLGLPASEVAHVGDAPEDIEGALAAQLTPVWINRDGNSKMIAAADFRRHAQPKGHSWSHAGLVIRSLRELLDLFAEEGT